MLQPVLAELLGPFLAAGCFHLSLPASLSLNMYLVPYYLHGGVPLFSSLEGTLLLLLFIITTTTATTIKIFDL